MQSPVPTSGEGRALYICSQIATVVLALFFVGLFFGSGVGWLVYSLKYPESITDTVPANFPVIVKRTAAREGEIGSTELVTWHEWKSRQAQEQGTTHVWVENEAGHGQRDRLLYTYHISEEAPQRYMVHVSATDQNDVEIRAQYRVEGNIVMPLFFRYLHASMMIVVIPMLFFGTLLFGLSLRAVLGWYTRYTGGEKAIRQLMSHDLLLVVPPLTLPLLVGYYLFLGGRRASRLVWQRS